MKSAHQYRRKLLALLTLLTVTSLQAIGLRGLFLPASARLLGLGGGGVAFGGSASLTTLNPAHVWSVPRESLATGYLRMYGDLNGSTFQWQRVRNDKPIQLLLRSYSEEGFELRGDHPTTEPLGLFDARQISLAWYRGIALGGIQAGLGLAAYYQRLFEHDGSGMLASFGLRGGNRKLLWGLAANQFGLERSLLGSWRFVAPQLAVGAGMKVTDAATFLADLLYDDLMGVDLGVAGVLVGSSWDLNLGVRMRQDDLRLAGGAVLHFGPWEATVGGLYPLNGLGLPYMVSLGRTF